VKVLALDYGRARTGVAVSDPSGTIARPLGVVERAHTPGGLDRIAELVTNEQAEQVVAGLPLTLRGEIGPQAQLVQAFAKALERAIPVPVRLFDERLTTVAAERMMLDLGMKPDQRKARIDEVAASIILQDFLDSIREREKL